MANNIISPSSSLSLYNSSCSTSCLLCADNLTSRILFFGITSILSLAVALNDFSKEEMLCGIPTSISQLLLWWYRCMVYVVLGETNTRCFVSRIKLLHRQSTLVLMKYEGTSLTPPFSLWGEGKVEMGRS